ncbi:aldehyde dehydrogenase domain-containing protein [Xylariaceae sp. FL1019]|nr:aldehyde dehydrogenase domain-containing protein [Xylariaceae sp. FL1019]
MSDFETRLFINGEYVESKSSERLTCYNPVDNSVVTSDVHVAGKEDIDAAVAAARAAFPKWAATPSQKRQEIIVKFASLLEEHSRDISRLECIVTGKPISMAPFETQLAASIFRYYAGWIDKVDGESFPVENGFMRFVRREPIGVCAGIFAFNGTMAQVGMKSGACLAMGNTAILKPSEKTPLAAIYIGKLAKEAGFPPGVFQVVNGRGETGSLLASHMDIDKISFTGSVGTGKKIAQMAAASNLKKVTLELGGKSPSIVFPDANLEVATTWCVQGITINAGQVCIASSRVYVHKDIKEKFVAAMKTAFEKTTEFVGDPQSADTRIGTLADKIQFDRVSKYIENGKSEATLVTGGDQMFGEASLPHTNPKPDAKIYKEEIFGPVVVISEFEDEDDVVARANDSPFGLAGAVFSQDINRALRIAANVKAGTMCINCCSKLDPTVPFGGYKASGWGREMGKAGIDAYTQLKTVFVNMTY